MIIGSSTPTGPGGPEYDAARRAMGSSAIGPIQLPQLATSDEPRGRAATDPLGTTLERIAVDEIGRPDREREAAEARRAERLARERRPGQVPRDAAFIGKAMQLGPEGFQLLMAEVMAEHAAAWRVGDPALELQRHMLDLRDRREGRAGPDAAATGVAERAMSASGAVAGGGEASDAVVAAATQGELDERRRMAFAELDRLGIGG